MLEHTQDEINAEAEVVSKAILERLTALEGANGKKWITKNWFSIISLGTILITIGVGWGTMRAKLESYDTALTNHVAALHASISQLNTRLGVDEEDMKDHITQTDRHVDDTWKREIRDSINGLSARIDRLMQARSTAR